LTIPQKIAHARRRKPSNEGNAVTDSTRFSGEQNTMRLQCVQVAQLLRTEIWTVAGVTLLALVFVQVIMLPARLGVNFRPAADMLLWDIAFAIALAALFLAPPAVLLHAAASRARGDAVTFMYSTRQGMLRTPRLVLFSLLAFAFGAIVYFAALMPIIMVQVATLPIIGGRPDSTFVRHWMSIWSTGITYLVVLPILMRVALLAPIHIVADRLPVLDAWQQSWRRMTWRKVWLAMPWFLPLFAVYAMNTWPPTAFGGLADWLFQLPAELFFLQFPVAFGLASIATVPIWRDLTPGDEGSACKPDELAESAVPQVG